MRIVVSILSIMLLLTLKAAMGVWRASVTEIYRVHLETFWGDARVLACTRVRVE